MTSKFELNDKVWFVSSNAPEVKQGEIIRVKFEVGRNTPRYDIIGACDSIPEENIFRTKEEATEALALYKITYKNLESKEGELVYVLKIDPKGTTLHKGMLLGVLENIGCLVYVLNENGTSFVLAQPEEVFTDEKMAYKIAMINEQRVKVLGLTTNKCIWDVTYKTRNLDEINKRLVSLGLTPV